MTLRAAVLQRLPLVVAWHLAAEAVGLRRTRVVAVVETGLGHAIEIAISTPTTAADIERSAPAIAVAFGLPRVRLMASTARADRVTIWFDAKLGLGVVPFVEADNPVGMPLDPLRKFAIGLDDNGEVVELSPYGQHILIGGNPGSGKSLAMRVFIANLATSRNVQLFGIDPKHAELSMWSARFSSLVLGSQVGPTVSLLEELLEIVHARAKQLAMTKSATLSPSVDNPWIVLVVDEWAEVAAAGDSKERAVVATLLRRYVSLGRAVGCTALLCTQRPTSDTIDVGTRALTTHRFALKCGDRHQAEAILGVGSFSPEQLTSAAPGRALWSDGGTATAVQFFYISDVQVPQLVKAGFR